MNKKGFTLIELLVVVLIIGILAAIALPQYMKAVEKSRATEAISVLGNLANAEKIYQMAQNTYTDDLTVLDITMPGVSNVCTKTFATNNFTFTVNTASGNSFVATAQRNGKSGADAYGLGVVINSNGDVTRYCYPGATAVTSVPSTLDTSTQGGVMCKSIANGNTAGVIK